MGDHYKAFNSIALRLGRRHELSTIFNDLLTMAVCAFHQTNIGSGLTKKDPTNEALYMSTIKGYERDELDDFGALLGHLQANVLDAPYSDLLGVFYSEHITMGHNGQYFTPEPVCKIMAQLTTPEENPVQQHVLDPACGSARTLLCFAELHPDNYFYGADNNITCAKMSCVNLFLNGLRGEVSWLNSLSNEWYGGWNVNTNGLGIVPIEKESSYIWLHPPESPAPDPSGTQLHLF